MGAPTCRHRLEIAPRPEHRDPRGEAVAAWAARELGLAGLVVRTRDVYRVDADLDEAEARRVLAELGSSGSSRDWLTAKGSQATVLPVWTARR